MRETGESFRVIGDLSVTNQVMENTFWVGVYPGMTDDKLDYMVQIIREAIKQAL